MKPSKKKNCQDKTVVNVKASIPTIDTYFKAAARQFNLNVEEKKVPDEADLRGVYIDALKKKLEGFVGGEAENFGEIQNSGELDGTDEAQNSGEGQAIGNADKNNKERDVGASGITPQDKRCESDKQNGSEPECTGCKQWETKYNDLQKLCLRLTIRNADMDLKFEDLLKTKTGKNQFIPNSGTNQLVPSSGANQLVPSSGANQLGAVVASANNFFTERELKFLECMSLDKKDDSTFVHHCIKFAYKDNPHILVKRTLKGTAEVLEIAENGEVENIIPGKDPMTPPKVERIRNLFIERISKCQIGAVGYSMRIKDSYLNKLIGNGVRNISKKNKNGVTEAEM